MAGKIVLDSQIDLFSNIIQHLVVFSESIRIIGNNDTCLIDAINDSQTSLCNIKLTSLWFTEYEMNNSITLIVNTSLLYKIIRVLDRSYPITFELFTNELQIQGKSVQSDVVYKIPSLAIDIPIIEVPSNIEYSADVSMTSKTLCSTLENLMILGDDCSIHIQEESMLFTAEGDLGSTIITLSMEDLNSYVIEENVNLKLEFHLKMLHIVSLFYKLSDTIDMHVSDDKPLVIQYNMKNDSYLRFMIAPKISDD